MADAEPVAKALGRFDEFLQGPDGSHDERLLPSRLAQATTAALDVDGAALTVAVDEVRVPIGSSSAEAALAESLQFTEGAGPSFETLRSGQRVDVPAADLGRRWTRLAARWREQTPYRSTLSAPVPLDGVAATVDLYMTHGEDGSRLDSGVVEAVADLLGRRLGNEFVGGRGGPSLTRRAEVWTAIGMVIGRTGDSSDVALELLREHAAAHGDLLDELAHQLVTGTTSLVQVVC